MSACSERNVSLRHDMVSGMTSLCVIYANHNSFTILFLFTNYTEKKKDLYRIYLYIEEKIDTNFIFSKLNNFIIRPIIFYYKKYNLICCLIKL